MDAAITEFVSPAFQPELLLTEALEDEITELAASITVATARMLLLLAELDRREPWGAQGLRSTAHWLNWKCGIDLGAAREKVRVARALCELPLIRAAFCAGKVSYSKVRAMTRVASIDNEQYLLMIACHGTAAHVEQLVRGYRRARRLEDNATANEVYAKREVRWYWDEDGSFVLNAQLPAEVGAVVLKAIEAALEKADVRSSAESVSAETSHATEPFAARRADALGRIAEQYLSNGDVAIKQADRFQVVVHVNADTLRTEGEVPRCEVEHGPSLPVATARRLACDAALVRVDSDSDGSVLNVGRKTRSVPPAIRRALNIRDRTCQFPGCTQYRFIDAHHVHHWADGGSTSLNNLVLLCRHHHRLIHEGGFDITARDDGKFLFFDPMGRLIPHAPATVIPQRTVDDIVAAARINVSAETLLPEWYGESMDLGMAVEGLYAQSQGIANTTVDPPEPNRFC